jgi:hypothetical protein
MLQAQNFSRLMSGYQIPTGSTAQTVGPQAGAYSNSPLSQIAGLGTLIASLYGKGRVIEPEETKREGGSVGYADGGEVGSPAYHDGNGNFYDANGYLVS